MFNSPKISKRRDRPMKIKHVKTDPNNYGKFLFWSTLKIISKHLLAMLCKDVRFSFSAKLGNTFSLNYFCRTPYHRYLTGFYYIVFRYLPKVKRCERIRKYIKTLLWLHFFLFFFFFFCKGEPTKTLLLSLKTW